MAGITFLEAAALSQNPLARGIFKSIVQEDELFSTGLRFVPRAGESFEYTREGSLPAVDWVPADGTMPSASNPTYDRVVVPKRILASQVDVSTFSQLNQSEMMDQNATAIRKLAKALGHEISRVTIAGAYGTGYTLGSSADPFAAITALTAGPHLDSDRHGPGEIKYTDATTSWQFRAPGDRDFGPAVEAAADGTFVLPSANASKFVIVTLDVSAATADGRTWIEFSSTSDEPDGLAKLVTADQTLPAEGTDGDDLKFATLDALIDAVKVRDERAFIMAPAVRRKFFAQLRALGGTGPEYVEARSFDGFGNDVVRRLPAYRGIPILVNESVPTDETVGATTTASSVYLASLAEGEGLYWGCFGGASFDVEADPRDRSVLGLVVQDVGLLEGSGFRRWRGEFHGGLALGSTLAAARVSGIKTA